MKENFHVRFGERGGETRRPQGRKVRSAPTLRSGMISEYFSDQTGAHVTGIDFIPKAIQDVRRRAHGPSADRLDFRVMDISRLDVRAASFDVIVAVDTLYFTDTVETLRGCRPLLRDGGRLIAFFDQSCGPATPLEHYPSDITLADNTDLARALLELGFSYRTWDYSEAMLAHLRRRRPVLAALKPQFEAEGNLFLYDSHLGESLCIERAYTHDAGKRYLYLASPA